MANIKSREANDAYDAFNQQFYVNSAVRYSSLNTYEKMSYLSLALYDLICKKISQRKA